MHKLRHDATYDIRHALEEVLGKTDYIYAGCINCENFTETSELCKLANQRPPVRVLLFGCPKWEFNGIPF